MPVNTTTIQRKASTARIGRKRPSPESPGGATGLTVGGATMVAAISASVVGACDGISEGTPVGTADDAADGAADGGGTYTLGAMVVDALGISETLGAEDGTALAEGAAEGAEE